MRDRKQILLDLLNNIENSKLVSNELSAYEWDCNESLVTVFNSHVTKNLNKFVAGEIDACLLELWANTIECREDVDFENELTHDVIVKLANPILYGNMSVDMANALLYDLSK